MVVFRKAMFKFGHRLICGNPRHVLPWSVVAAKALIQHGVALALGHVFELARLDIAQTGVFHSFSFPVTQRTVAHRAVILSSFGQTENRQPLHFFLASSDEPVGSCCDRMAAIPWGKPGQRYGGTEETATNDRQRLLDACAGRLARSMWRSPRPLRARTSRCAGLPRRPSCLWLCST
jgi:hypothetical protein